MPSTTQETQNKSSCSAFAQSSNPQQLSLYFKTDLNPDRRKDIVVYEVQTVQVYQSGQ